MMVPSAVDRDARRATVPPAIPTVFVVDDDLSVRESVESLLLYCGWHVETFEAAATLFDRARDKTLARFRPIPSGRVPAAFLRLQLN